MIDTTVNHLTNTEILDKIECIMEAGERMDVDAVEFLLRVLQERAPVMVDYDLSLALQSALQKWVCMENSNRK